MVLYREIRGLGYEGGLTQLKVFLAFHKRLTPEPVVRLETAPASRCRLIFTHVRRGRGTPWPGSDSIYFIGSGARLHQHMN